jgi:hypothetical protein
MHPGARTSLIRPVAAFVVEHQRLHGAPPPPPIFPPEILERATFTQADVDRTHFVDEAGYYRAFPLLYHTEEAEFQRIVALWARRFRRVGFSEDGLRKRLEHLITECLNHPNDIDALTNALIDKLLVPPITDVLLPMFGIELGLDELPLAPDVRLVQMTPERFDREVTQRFIEASGPSELDYASDTVARAMANMLAPSFVNQPALLIRAAGDETAALEAAKVRADRVVDALQFAAAAYHHHSWRAFIDWTGDVPRQGWRHIGQIPVHGHVLPANPGELRGELAPWRIDAAQRDKLINDRMADVIKAVLSNSTEEHIDHIRRAVSAVADGERQRSVDGKKLSYITVFDIFFSVRDVTETTRMIREGVAFTLCKGAEARVELAKFVNMVYESRSRTSHDNERGRFSEADLMRLRTVALQLIGVLYQRSAFTKKSLREEIEAERTRMGDAYAGLAKLCRPKAKTSANAD